MVINYLMCFFYNNFEFKFALILIQGFTIIPS